MKKDNSHLLLVLQSAENNFITFSLHLLYLPFHVKNFTEEMLKHLGGGLEGRRGISGSISLLKQQRTL